MNASVIGSTCYMNLRLLLKPHCQLNQTFWITFSPHVLLWFIKRVNGMII